MHGDVYILSLLLVLELIFFIFLYFNYFYLFFHFINFYLCLYLINFYLFYYYYFHFYFIIIVNFKLVRKQLRGFRKPRKYFGTVSDTWHSCTCTLKKQCGTLPQCLNVEMSSVGMKA